MKLEMLMCHSHLVSMMLMPEYFAKAINRYESTAPDMCLEGVNGYMEIKVTFWLKDLREFNELWDRSYRFPSDRSEWYWKVRNGSTVKNGE